MLTWESRAVIGGPGCVYRGPVLPCGGSVRLIHPGCIIFPRRFISKNFEIMVVRSFCFGLNILSPLALIAKNGDFESSFNILSPIGKGNMSEGLYQLRVWRNNDKE